MTQPRREMSEDAAEDAVEELQEADMRAEFEAEMQRDMMSDMPSPAELAEFERQGREASVRIQERQRLHAEMGNYRVSWAELTLEDIHALKRALNHAEQEEDLQRFLTANKQFLIQHLSGGHIRFVIPKPKLGKSFVPDYLLVNEDSGGHHWHGVELEAHTQRMFISTGQPAAPLTHSIQQIVDWREWLKNNIAHARAPEAEGGCGLVGIDGELPATILIGRRSEYPASFNAFRRQTEQKSRIAIHSYDWLVDRAQERVLSFER